MSVTDWGITALLWLLLAYIIHVIYTDLWRSNEEDGD